MVDLGGDFDSGTVEPQKPLEPLNGWFAVQAVKSEERDVKPKPGQKPGSKLLWFEFEVVESVHPEHKGRKVWAYINHRNHSAQARDIAKAELAALCLACDQPVIRDTEELHGIPIAVRCVADGEYTRIKGYEPFSSRFQDGQPASSTQSTASAPGGSKQPPW